MEDWVIAGLAGWCLTGVVRLPASVLLALAHIRHGVSHPEPPPHPSWGPLPDPWSPLIQGLLGAIGGVAAWSLVGARLAERGLGTAVVVGVLGGSVGLTLGDTFTAVRTRNVRG